MQINSTVKTKLIDDYVFVFQGGHIRNIQVDPSAGDSIEFISGGIKIDLAPRPGISNPDEMVPAEDITIFAQHLLCIEHTKRTVEVQTPEQRFEWKQTIKEVGKTTVH